MTFKKKYKILLFVILPMFVLSFIAYKHYQDKTMYEKYISQSVSFDMRELVKAIIESDAIYNDILTNGYMTRADAEELKIYSYDILQVTQEYGSIALVFDRRGDREFKNKTAGVTQEMGSFFFEMNKDIDIVDMVDGGLLDEKIFEIDEDGEIIINRLKELNALWVKSVEKNVVGVANHNGKLKFDWQAFENHYGDNSLADDFWVDLIMDIDQNTRDFLIEHRLTTKIFLNK